MKREEALKLLSKIEAYRETPAMHEDKSNKLYRVEAGEVHEIKRSNYGKALDIIASVYGKLAAKLLVESAT